MTQSCEPTPIDDYRSRLLEYLNGLDLPFTCVALEIVKEHLAAAKALAHRRPLLLLWAYEVAGGGSSADPVAVAAAFALFDRFMLVHNELAEPRNAGTGAVARWGLGQSLNAGDALYALALRALAEGPLHPERRLAVASLVVRRVVDAIEGRNVDVSAGGGATLLERVRSMRRRSAGLTGAALWAGACLAGAPDRVVRAFDRAGHLLGVAAAASDDPALARRIRAKGLAAIERAIGPSAGLDVLRDTLAS